MASIAVFDFISHATMHLPFNEGYLRTLLAAFPNDRIVFHAREGHVAALRAAFPDDAPITWTSVEPFTPAFGQSRHHPVGGRVGAWRVWRQMRRVEVAEAPKLTTLLGFDANMLDVLGRLWPSPSLLHLVLHNQLAETVTWRSRNPAIRRFDLTTVMRRGLPANIRVLTLELGIREALADYAPRLARNIDVFKHPILESEWGDALPLDRSETLRVAFLGHASRGKGFDKFVEWATTYASQKMEFHGIGCGSDETRDFDQSALARPVTAGSVPRDEYVAALAKCHVACLPLPSHYNYVASGSLIDAIAGLKPVFCYRNYSYEQIEMQYGPFGVMADDVNALGAEVGALSREGLPPAHVRWADTLRRIRAARAPAQLAPGYRALVEQAAFSRSPKMSRGWQALLPVWNRRRGATTAGESIAR